MVPPSSSILSDNAATVVNAINAQTNVTGVTASINGANHLVLTSANADTAITIGGATSANLLAELGVAAATTNPTNLLTQGAVIAASNFDHYGRRQSAVHCDLRQRAGSGLDAGRAPIGAARTVGRSGVGRSGEWEYFHYRAQQYRFDYGWRHGQAYPRISALGHCPLRRPSAHELFDERRRGRFAIRFQACRCEFNV